MTAAREALQHADEEAVRVVDALREAFGARIDFIRAGDQLFGKDPRDAQDLGPEPGSDRWLPPRLGVCDKRPRPPAAPDFKEWIKDWSVKRALALGPRDPFRRYAEDQWRAEFRARVSVSPDT